MKFPPESFAGKRRFHLPQCDQLVESKPGAPSSHREAALWGSLLQNDANRGESQAERQRGPGP